MYCLTDDCTLILCSTTDGKVINEISLPILKVEPVFDENDAESNKVTKCFLESLLSTHFRHSLKLALAFRAGVEGHIYPFIGTYDDLVWLLNKCLESIDCLVQSHFIKSIRVTFTAVSSDKSVEVLLV